MSREPHNLIHSFVTVLMDDQDVDQVKIQAEAWVSPVASLNNGVHDPLEGRLRDIFFSFLARVEDHPGLAESILTLKQTSLDYVNLVLGRVGIVQLKQCTYGTLIDIPFQSLLAFKQ